MRIKQFPSKYPFKQYPRVGMDVIFEGHKDEHISKLATGEEKDLFKSQLRQDTKFIIIYKS